MPVRDVIEIDETLCDGCGECVPACSEGAIQIIDGKARLVSDTYCDGLGDCLGHCPQGAIRVVRREAEPFDEEAVQRHLPRTEGSKGLPVFGPRPDGGCPGSRQQAFTPPARPSRSEEESGDQPSRLGQWPVQLHLLSPTAPFLEGSELLLAADCTAYAVGGFHDRFLDGRSLAIACPKLDTRQEVYLQKLAEMIDHGGIRGLTVMVMEVPCCGGLVDLVRRATEVAERRVGSKVLTVSIRGEIIEERTLEAA